MKNFRIILILFTAVICYAANEADGTYSISDYFQESGNIWILNYDDTGNNGILLISDFSLYQNLLTLNGLEIADPLYRQTPYSWYTPHFFSYDKGFGNNYRITPDFTKTDTTESAFNYYRGDWGQGSFTGYFSSKINDDLTFRILGENQTFDGVYGYLGPYLSSSGESVSQHYNIDIIKESPGLKSQMGVAFRLTNHGLLRPDTYSDFSNSYLDWANSEVFTGYRKIKNVNTYINLQDSSWTADLKADYFKYGVNDDSDIWNLNAESVDYSGLLSKSFHIFGTSRIYLNPVIRSTWFRYGQEVNQNLLSVGMESVSKSGTYIKVGFTNTTPVFQFSYNKLVKNIQFNLNTARKYISYPAIYHADYIQTTLNEIPAGYTLLSGDASLGYSKSKLQLLAGMSVAHYSMVTPFKTAFTDTLITLIEKTRNPLYFLSQGEYTLPWRMSIKYNLMAAPWLDSEDYLTLQTWGQIRQDLSLFKNNLNIYVAGELHYIEGGTKMIWMTDINSIGWSANSYFTNSRLNLNAKIGIKVSDFHLFYAIYNGEGRQFSPIAGMPYRYSLGILGIEWLFLN